LPIGAVAVGALGVREQWRLQMDAKKDMLADLDIASLFQQRAEAIERQKKTSKALENAKARHFFILVLVGCVTLAAAASLSPRFPEVERTGMLLLSASGVSFLAAFLPGLTVLRRQDEANAATRNVKAIDDKIAFCNLVLDEAKRVKVRKYAEAWVAKELS
jgi:hypothetical protein